MDRNCKIIRQAMFIKRPSDIQNIAVSQLNLKKEVPIVSTCNDSNADKIAKSVDANKTAV